MAANGVLTTHRFNWMGADHTESSLEILNLMRSESEGAKSTAMKYKSLDARRKAAARIRTHLDKIKRELELQAMGVDPNTSEESLRAAGETTSLIRGARYRTGEQLVSYIDGTTHESVAELRRYNHHLRARLDEVVRANPREDISVPEAGEFDAADVDAAVKELHAASSDLASAKEEQAAEGDAGAALDQKEHRAKDGEAKLAVIREAYNERATHCSRYLASFGCVRRENLADGYDAHATDRVVE